MKPVALITSSKWSNPIRGDLTLQKALGKIGLSADIMCWDEPSDWDKYGLIILRSCWDYYAHYKEFLAWLTDLEQNNIPIANGYRRIRENIDKARQLNQLDTCPIKPLPYLLCDTLETTHTCLHRCKWDQIVLKPTVSSGGYHVVLADRRQKGWLRMAEETAFRILEDRHDIIIQPFVSSVVEGEVSLIYFQGEFSHSVVRYPGVFNVKKAPLSVLNLPSQWREAGNKICHFLQGKQLLYLRIDLVKYFDEIRIMEVELAEPDLYFDLNQNGSLNPADTFARNIYQVMLG